MEASIEKAGFEVDVTLEDCVGKRNNFFKCVTEKKNELTKSLTNEEWSSYGDRVNKIQIDCFAEKGLNKCAPFFDLGSIKY